MNMEIIKKYKGLLVLALVVIVGAFFFFYRFYHNDVKALADISISYHKFDKAISEFFSSGTDDLESKADNALIELSFSGACRI